MACVVEEGAGKVGIGQLEGVVESPERGAERIADPGQTSARVCVRFCHEEWFTCGLCDEGGIEVGLDEVDDAGVVEERGENVLGGLFADEAMSCCVACPRSVTGASRRKERGLTVGPIEQRDDRHGRRQNRCTRPAPASNRRSRCWDR